MFKNLILHRRKKEKNTPEVSFLRDKRNLSLFYFFPQAFQVWLKLSEIFNKSFFMTFINHFLILWIFFFKSTLALALSFISLVLRIILHLLTASLTTSTSSMPYDAIILIYFTVVFQVLPVPFLGLLSERVNEYSSFVSLICLMISLFSRV